MRALAFLLLIVSLHGEPTPAPAAAIAIQPLGEVRAERIEIVKNGLESAFGIKVATLPAKPLPKEAWYAPRQRYRADSLLEDLLTTTGQNLVIIGLTAKDISVPKGQHEDWGIFGLGQLDGRVCVVSTYRLGARGADEAKLRDRLRKVAIHEVGHVMSLPHCPHPSCVMNDAEGSIATVDQESGVFCEPCSKGWKSWLADKKQ